MALRSERLVILLSKGEKARLAKLAARRKVSMGELARTALIQLDGAHLEPQNRGQGFAEWPGDWPENDRVTAAQAAALDHLADAALRTLSRANEALDRAFGEVEATRAYFARKRAGASPAAEPEADVETGT